MTMAGRQRRVAQALRPGSPQQVIEVAVEDIAELEPDQALVQVQAAAVNHSEGLALRGGAYAQGLEFPCPLGYEAPGPCGNRASGGHPGRHPSVLGPLWWDRAPTM